MTPYSGLTPVGGHAPCERHHGPGIRPGPAFVRAVRPGHGSGPAAAAFLACCSEAISSGTLDRPGPARRFLSRGLRRGHRRPEPERDQPRRRAARDLDEPGRFTTVPIGNYNYTTPTGQSARALGRRRRRAPFNQLKADQPPAGRAAAHGSTRPRLNRGQVSLDVYNGTLIGGLSAGTGRSWPGSASACTAPGSPGPASDIARTVIEYPAGQIASARLVRKVLPGATLRQVPGCQDPDPAWHGRAPGHRLTAGFRGPGLGRAGPSHARPRRTAAQDACK